MPKARCRTLVLAIKQMQIRRFKEGDESTLWEIFYNTIHRINANDYTQEQVDAWAPANFDSAIWRKKINRLRPFVIEHNGEIVGYADLQADGYIDHFYCHHSRQRQGIGRMLMNNIHEAAKARGIRRLYSDVSVTAKPFFAALGFEVIKEQLISIRNQELLNFRMQAELSDPLTEAVRTGIPRQSGKSGLELAAAKLTGAIPMGIDAPTKGLRKAIGGGWELLALLKYGFGALFFLVIGIAGCYFGVRETFDVKVVGFGIGSLALSILLARWALHAARNLRAIAKA